MLSPLVRTTNYVFKNSKYYTYFITMSHVSHLKECLHLIEIHLFDKKNNNKK